eukprot:7231347-Heterocapsa_arctica.AAC.1
MCLSGGSLARKLACIIMSTLVTRDQNECLMPSIFLRPRYCNASSLARSVSVRLSASSPYSNLETITASYTLSFHFMDDGDLDQKVFSFWRVINVTDIQF